MCFVEKLDVSKREKIVIPSCHKCTNNAQANRRRFNFVEYNFAFRKCVICVASSRAFDRIVKKKMRVCFPY